MTNPDAGSIATSGNDTGMVDHNVQAVVGAQHRLIVAPEVTNIDNDRSQLSRRARPDGDRRSQLIQRRRDSGLRGSGRAAARSEAADLRRNADGRFGKQDFVYDEVEDVYLRPAGEKLTRRYWNVEAG